MEWGGIIGLIKVEIPHLPVAILRLLLLLNLTRLAGTREGGGAVLWLSPLELNWRGAVDPSKGAGRGAQSARLQLEPERRLLSVGPQTRALKCLSVCLRLEMREPSSPLIGRRRRFELLSREQIL